MAGYSNLNKKSRAWQKMRYIQILFVSNFNTKDMTQLLVWNENRRNYF